MGETTLSTLNRCFASLAVYTDAGFGTAFGGFDGAPFKIAPQHYSESAIYHGYCYWSNVQIFIFSSE